MPLHGSSDTSTLHKHYKNNKPVRKASHIMIAFIALWPENCKLRGVILASNNQLFHIEQSSPRGTFMLPLLLMCYNPWILPSPSYLKSQGKNECSCNCTLINRSLILGSDLSSPFPPARWVTHLTCFRALMD